AGMLAQKQRAREDMPDFAAAVAREKQGNALSQQLAFKEAADNYRAAADLFARAVPPPPAARPKAPPADPQREIRAVIESYAQALERKDLALLQKVSPGLKPDDLRRIRDSFDRSQSLKATLKVETIEVTGDEARARGRREDILVTTDGRTFRNESGFSFRLKRRGDGWGIEALN
ncbi:MAG TPA: nuclear transport factor 2 family protein, partial [Methylomirabilota bacterium]|nr:nuclear transport factor 2 family protein [Methylomirabilota bacterium]